MSRETTEYICDIIGTVCSSIRGVDEDGGSFMRVKVTLDVYLPLCRRRLISLETGEKHWIKFKYERLPNICYWCRCLDCDDKECSLWIVSKGTLTPDQKQYDHTLRASPYRSYYKPVVFVPGFYEDVGVQRHKNTSEAKENHQPTVEHNHESSTADPEPNMEMDIREGIINAKATIPPPSTSTVTETPAVPSSNILESTILDDPQRVLGKAGVSLHCILADDILFNGKL